MKGFIMNVEDRITRLERTNRLLWLSLFGSIGVLIICGATLPYRGDIVAKSIKTRSLYVSNPYGKQGLQVEVGDTGMVDLTITDPHGAQTIAIGTEANGTPSICLSSAKHCRVTIGDAYRGNSREMTFQLLDQKNRIVWMPPKRNPQ